MSIPTPEEQINFIANIQRILDEGQFVSTYKFALIRALADYSVDFGDDSGAPITLETDHIAELFIEYYWRQSFEYPHGKQDIPSSVLKQGAGKQPAILNWVKSLREKKHEKLNCLKNDTKLWGSFKKKVANKIEEMPLWKLQMVGGNLIDFLYLQQSADNKVHLKPGVVYCFRRFHSLILSLVQSSWIRHVRSLNVSILEESDLSAFLFGTERSTLKCLQPILKDIQDNKCFYCNERLHGDGEIDHFVPWSRYPFDLGHNFVLAHGVCNRSKSDVLAASCHLKRWHNRNDIHRDMLCHEFDKYGVLHNVIATNNVAIWAYTQASYYGANFWLSKGNVVPYDDKWKRIISNT